MRIVQVAPFSAIPPSKGGAQSRMHGLMTARRDTDSVVRYTNYSLREDAKSGWKRIGDDYQEYRDKSYLNSGINYIFQRFQLPPMLTSQILTLRRTETLTSLTTRADVVMVEFPWQYPYVYRLVPKDVPVIYSSHNYELETYNHLQETRIGATIYERLRKFEQMAVETADLVITTSTRDKKQYRENFDTSTDIYVAPNAAYRPEEESPAQKSDIFDQLPRNELSTLFVGSNHFPNVKAVEKIIKLAREVSKEVQYLIVGDVCSSFSKSEIPENVYLLGYVDDLTHLYQECDVALNPITTGGGSNVKLPEYFSQRIPVITTPFGARGIPAEDGKHFIVAEVEEFSQILKRILQNEIEDLDIIAQNAYDIFDERLNWQNVSEELLDEIRKLC